jgi:DNA mismatch repair protein MutS
MPTVTNDDIIHISEGRHPVVERMLSQERFIPNNLTLNFSNSMIAIITGPNMAGKSTFMRQTALIVLLAQTGSFVPASRAIIGLVDRIYTRIGASDFIAKGQSTFMVEMMETANILNNATNRSLIILDEIGRGTSTFDGISIAWAVVEYISKKIKSRTLFATHYHELTELALVLEGVKNFNVVVREWGDEIIFLRKIEEGPADRSYGIQVARLAGIPRDVITRSKEILANLENDELNGSSQPKLAHKKGKKKKKVDIQLNLFASPEELIKEEIMSLTVSDLTPEGALKKLQDIKKRLERD